jgi:hypothetical protein
MKIQAIRTIAEKIGVKVGSHDKVALIRTIQRAEGNNDCFATSFVRACNQLNCLW